MQAHSRKLGRLCVDLFKPFTQFLSMEKTN